MANKGKIDNELDNELLKKVVGKQLNKMFGVKFSKNALNKLVLYEIKLSKKDLEQLKCGVEKAAKKGSKLSLIVVNDIAYIVSVKNSTVITALSNFRIGGAVVDAIDSIVFM